MEILSIIGDVAVLIFMIGVSGTLWSLIKGGNNLRVRIGKIEDEVNKIRKKRRDEAHHLEIMKEEARLKKEQVETQKEWVKLHEEYEKLTKVKPTDWQSDEEYL